MIAEKNYRKKLENTQFLAETFGNSFTYHEVIQKWLPVNLLYILRCPKSDLNEELLKLERTYSQRKPPIKKITLYVPENFSVVDNSRESFAFLRKTILTLLFGHYKSVYFSYKKCRQLDIGAQVVLDIIKKDAISFINKCRSNKIIKRRSRAAIMVGLTDAQETLPEIQKILLSVGSLAVQANFTRNFKDVIPYRLCVHNRGDQSNRLETIERKDIDTTTLTDYVQDSLARLNKKLTLDKLDDLCTIIGEILINAEEHSTTQYRFSIGYFQEKRENGRHFGVFRLVILNFGKTIYEKFAEPQSPNKEIIGRMQHLSSEYTKKRLFRGKEFEEENLWTLYALQEGVTSIPNKKRGNGSIQFIESFFSLKGEGQIAGEKSRMTILSGNTRIIFDGTHRIIERISDGQKFKVMTFNKSGKIEQAPDKRFVQYAENYFPGTLISAKIFLNEDDFDENAN